ncbi:hypothetical protein SOVF_055020 [Spinacia oleracea]|nr:hypothetical protein SOVF_055020 [Spinacia oleracea]
MFQVMAETCSYLHKKIALLFFFVALTFAQDEKQFMYNGFQGAKLHLDGLANIHPNGLLQMTNSSLQGSGHVFYPQPLKFNTSRSFSTTFVFAINTDVPGHGGHGIAFVISSSMNFDHAVPAEYLGIFNISNNGNNSNHVIAVELDTVQNAVFKDIDGNHVGIDINGLESVGSASVAYYSDEERKNMSLQLSGGTPMQIWIDYDGAKMLMNVTVAPLKHPKPKKYLLSTPVNLSPALLDPVYVGFSSSTGLTATEHYISGWSWSQIGQAQDLDLTKLPSFPKIRSQRKKLKVLFIVLIVVLSLLLEMIAGVAFAVWRKKYEELKEPWEQEYISHRFSFKDLYTATKGFKDSELLGFGGFGKVYKELSITGKPTTATDVFSFGIFLLEVACGRRPNSLQEFSREDFVLVDWVYDCWKKGVILETSDPTLEGNHQVEEMELVLKLGLLCSHPKPEGRPSMRNVVQFLHGDASLPDIPSDYDHQSNSYFGGSWRISSSLPSLSSLGNISRQGCDLSEALFFRFSNIL